VTVDGVRGAGTGDETGPRQEIIEWIDNYTTLSADVLEEVTDHVMAVVARDRAQQEQKITEIRALHLRTEDVGLSGQRVYCYEDGLDWPCETVRILDGERRNER
jgi:hypothetical protein